MPDTTVEGDPLRTEARRAAPEGPTVRPAAVRWLLARRAGPAPDTRAYPPLPDGWRTPPAPQRLAVASIALAWAWGVLQLLLLAFASDEAERFASGSATAGLSPYGATSTALVAVQVAALVVVGLWVRRAQSFATFLGQDNRPRRGEAWPWFAWVVPVVSFWFPYQMMEDLRDATVGSRGGSTVGPWWGTFLAMNLVVNPLVHSVVGLRLEAPGALLAYEIVLTVLTWGALLLWVGVVRDITRAQCARAVC